MSKETPEAIALSFINGNLSWVKNECKNNPALVVKVLNELPEDERTRFYNWVKLW